jgi:2,3-dihydroxy-p-cumate/2,3-dihydroxybenzoate 3,4-dioxygenase
MAQASVTDLSYVGLAVPDLAAERDFFGTVWGLIEVAEQNGLVYLAAEGSPQPFVIRLRQDVEQKTDVIGLSAASRADVDTLAKQAEAAGGKLISQPGPLDGPGGGYGFRVFDLDGRAVEVKSEAEERPYRELKQGEAIPIGLSHVVVHSPDPKKMTKFYEDAFGFRLSDWIGEFMAFLRCNPAHHRLAILPGPPSLNHVAFDVASIDDMMRGLGRMLKNQIPLQWGPGRHTAGNNTFSYFTTPNGNAVEYTSDVEEVDEATWEPKVYPFTPEVTDQWGTGRMAASATHPAGKPDAGLWKVPA